MPLKDVVRNWFRQDPERPPSVVPKDRSTALRLELMRAKARVTAPKFIIKPPDIPPGVVPRGGTAGIATDEGFNQFCAGGWGSYAYNDLAGFPGYPYLSMLSTRAEYRAMASALSTELTREWIQITSTDTAGESTKKKITELTKAIGDMKLQQIIQRAAEHDALFGRAQLFVDIKGHDRSKPLIIDSMTIKKDSTFTVTPVEAIWTTPVMYNALDPIAPDFYKPSKWWMLGQQVDSSRLMTIVTRPLPDILKPAFNFGGMSLSQLAEPYVNNWLRTRQSVSNLINNFSIIALKTAMEQELSGDGDGTQLGIRAELFTAMRSNDGLMMLDKDREELEQIAVPLGGLDKLQAQAQEHMCAVSRLPAIILTGISPTGLNASSEGEIRVFYDWISAQQEAYWRWAIERIIQIMQLCMYGEIDPDLSWDFVPLFQMTEKELSEIRTADANAATAYFGIGAIDGDDVREKLARDPQSGYEGLDLNKEIAVPGEDEGDDDDSED